MLQRLRFNAPQQHQCTQHAQRFNCKYCAICLASRRTQRHECTLQRPRSQRCRALGHGLRQRPHTHKQARVFFERHVHHQRHTAHRKQAGAQSQQRNQQRQPGCAAGIATGGKQRKRQHQDCAANLRHCAFANARNQKQAAGQHAPNQAHTHVGVETRGASSRKAKHLAAKWLEDHILHKV